MEQQTREKIEYASELVRQGQEADVEVLYAAMGWTMLFIANTDILNVISAIKSYT